MYTRSYPRHEPPKKPPTLTDRQPDTPRKNLNDISVSTTSQSINEGALSDLEGSETESLEIAALQHPHAKINIPAGYCGTAILRKREKDEQESTAKESFSLADEVIRHAPSKARRFKVATKITPSLWSEKKMANDINNEIKEETECSESTDPSSFNIETNTECCTNDAFSENEHEEKAPCKKLGIKRRSRRKGDDKNLLKFTPVPHLRDRSFSLEDLLLGGLILLLLNEGADDDIILIFGFLLFSGL